MFLLNLAHPPTATATGTPSQVGAQPRRSRGGKYAERAKRARPVVPPGAKRNPKFYPGTNNIETACIIFMAVFDYQSHVIFNMIVFDGGPRCRISTTCWYLPNEKVGFGIPKASYFSI
jgi:hypothetical protein